MNRGGKRPGAGRKPKQVDLKRTETLTALLEAAWPQKQRVSVIKKLVSLANTGDVKAASLLLAYGYGRPTERVEVSGRDAQPIQIEVVEVRAPDGTSG